MGQALRHGCLPGTLDGALQNQEAADKSDHANDLEEGKSGIDGSLKLRGVAAEITEERPADDAGTADAVNAEHCTDHRIQTLTDDK